ncbi:GNAT family N-acetyltransferase [Gorillibacterium sp. sgz5001074]|uniref:GNAT family N-acetyltransferase n=1 Tax=Gorillibacterium sp. sgz5001074 TaxID=3446695 RepID=UPI003F6634A0
MEIRRIEEQDVTALGELYRELTGEASDPHRMRDVYEVIRKDPQYYLIGAFDSRDGLVGSVMGIVCYDLVKACRPFMVVENVVVAASCRGRGIGKALMLELERIAASRGCSYAMLVSGIHRQEAHRFYDALGYGPDRAKGFKKELREVPL